MGSGSRRGIRPWRRAAVVSAVPLAIMAAGFTSPASATDPGPDVVAGVSSSAPGTVNVGDSFDFTISVTNTGDQTAHDVVLSDDVPPGLKVTGPILPPFAGGQCSVASSQTPPAPPAYSVYCERAELPPGESSAATFSVVVTTDVACGSVSNEVRAKATDEPTANRGNNTASTSVEVACAASISLTNTGPEYARVGDRATFTLRATNTGGVSFDGVTVKDPSCDAPPAIVASGNGDAAMDPHEVWVYRCDAAITQATPHQFVTTATASGHSANETVTATARATVRVVHPRVTIAVTPTPASGAPGDVITYRYIVSNEGDVVLSKVVVTDDRLGTIGTIAQLSPGQSATLRATRVLTANNVWVVNTAAVVADEPTGRSVKASANAAITIVAATGNGTSDAPTGGTAFTGPAVRQPVLLASLLALLGAALLFAARRRA